MKLKSNFYIEVICILLILLFVYTGTSKYFDFGNFRHVLARSPLLGYFSFPIAIMVPAIELIISILLLIPSTKRLGLYASATLLTVFSIYIGYMLLFASHLPCGCGGVFRAMSWEQHLFFNIFFITLSVIGISIHSNERKFALPKIFMRITRRSRTPV